MTEMTSKNGQVEAFVKKIVPKVMKENEVPGFSIAIVNNGEIIYQEGFGARNIKKNMPATPHTLYGIGSCTKSFVAMAILQLMENGKLDLRDPVSDYIPLTLDNERGEPITIHHLMTHSSGIPSLGTSLIALSRGMGIRDLGVPWGTVNDFYRHLNGAEKEIAANPGNRFFYFNAGYRMLGHIIQEVSGKRFDKYISKNFLTPLEMKRSTLSKKRFTTLANTITPYWKKPDGGIEPSEFPYPDPSDNPKFSFILAAGGIMSSVHELTNYLTLNMNNGKFGATRVLSPESIDKMQKIYINRSPEYFGKHGYGYGWDITKNFLGHKLVAHGGSVLVSTAHLAFIPDLKAGVAMAANSQGFPYSAVAQGIFACMLEKDPEKVIPPLQIKDVMDTLTGTYKTYKGLSTVNIVKKAGMLYLEQKNQFSDMNVPLIPKSKEYNNYQFYIQTEGVRRPVEFVVESSNKIDLFIERNRFHKVSS